MFDILNTQHFFSGREYAKRMCLPAGYYAESHKHEHDHLSILAQGQVVVTVDGIATTYQGPDCITIKAGEVHRIDAVTDVVWFCIHATDETNPANVDQVLIQKPASVNFRKVADDFDVSALRTALARQPELFGTRNWRAAASNSPHAEMTDIWVRYNDEKNIGPHFNDEHDSVWYPEAANLPEVQKIVFDLMALVKGERLGAVLITKLPAGGKIPAHIDGGWHAEYYDKYFIPIQNEDGAVFGFEDGVITPALGDVYWFRNDRPHWVLNQSTTDRIALIVCIKSTKGE